MYRHHGGFVAPHKLGVKNREGLELDFPAYARMAAAGCGVPSPVAERLIEEHAESIYAEATSLRTHLYLLWTVRALLGHCVEAVVLLDRLAFLEEHGMEASLRVVFDGEESPRNVAVIATTGGRKALPPRDPRLTPC